MKQSEKKQVKAYLLKEKTKLETRIAELKELTKPIAPDCAIGRVSRMDAINNRSINEAALQKSRERQKKINISLEHIGDKDFGSCIHCGEPIPIQRLLIMPGALCVGCSGRV
ncbi:MAG: TraR/DksA family transcriptional regulator [Bacteroidales bacterium]|nr:TraR/DksA family transcriptional regulator [Bacteroidales bacterium]